MRLNRLGQHQCGRKIQTEPHDVQPWKAALKLLRGIFQKIGGNIDRNVLHRLQVRHQGSRFGAIACTQINQAGCLKTRMLQGCDQRLGDGFKNTAFGAGGVVLVQRGDGLKQLGAQRIVEKLGRNTGVRLQQASGQFVAGVGWTAGLGKVDEAGNQRRRRIFWDHGVGFPGAKR